MSLYSGGLIIGRIFTSEIWGAYFREGLSFIYLFIYLFYYYYYFFGGGGLLSEFSGIYRTVRSVTDRSELEYFLSPPRYPQVKGTECPLAHLGM